MCVAFRRSIKSVYLPLGPAAGYLLLAFLGGNGAHAEEVVLRGTLDSGGVQIRIVPQRYMQFSPDVEGHGELRLRPILEDWRPVAVKPVALPEQQASFWGLSYSRDTGFGYQYSENTKLNVGMEPWSIRMGITRSLPVPASGTRTQSFW